MSSGTVTVGFFLFDGVQALDFVGPWVSSGGGSHPGQDVFDSWKQFARSQVELVTFGETKVAPQLPGPGAGGRPQRPHLPPLALPGGGGGAPPPSS